MAQGSAEPQALDRLALLLHLSSPALPIGGFTYSQGLEAAVELGLIRDEAGGAEWIHSQLHTVLACAEAPLWCVMYDAWQDADIPALEAWNQWFHASRETQELRQETVQMGDSLARLAHGLDWGDTPRRAALQAIRPPSLPLVHSFACAAHGLPRADGLTAYLFTWLENQIASAIKSVPLGQMAGQRILHRLRQELPGVVAEAQRRSQSTPPDLQTFAPQYGIVSARHESQFSRLFRS